MLSNCGFVAIINALQFITQWLFFHILVLQEHWVLTESGIPLKPVLEGVRIVALSISSHEQTLFRHELEDFRIPT